jgi:hypothetical protein
MWKILSLRELCSFLFPCRAFVVQLFRCVLHVVTIKERVRYGVKVREFVSKSYARMRRRLRLTRSLNVSLTTRSSHSDIASTNATTEGRAEMLGASMLNGGSNGYNNRTSPK